LGGDTIGLCDKKVNMNMCLILNVYRDRAYCIYEYKKKNTWDWQ